MFPSCKVTCTALSTGMYLSLWMQQPRGDISEKDPLDSLPHGGPLFDDFSFLLNQEILGVQLPFHTDPEAGKAGCTPPQPQSTSPDYLFSFSFFKNQLLFTSFSRIYELVNESPYFLTCQKKNPEITVFYSPWF